MSVRGFADLREHIGHEIEIVNYGLVGDAPLNVAIECVTDGTVLLDYDNPAVAELNVFVTDDDVVPTCDICGGPQRVTDDWNGDTGNHRSCEEK
jgi:hypothetical protein